MGKNKFATIDGNEAVARIAYKVNEVIAIYPITPSSQMGEWADEWASRGQQNLWNTVPQVVEMQSEAGAAGAIHGSLQRGALTTTFTASQGLLLMLPNMYKIAGELTSAVFHVAARSIAAQALSIFGDHSDVMAARATGWGLLASASVQEAHDFALIAHSASLKARVPIIHFFDGFRTSHEISKIALIPDDVVRAMIDDELVQAHRGRGLNPENPVLRGTAQNPDVFFQARETVNPFYDEMPNVIQATMDEFAELTGRQYQVYEYYGAPDAERVVVLMASGCEAVHETVDALNTQDEKVGVLKVRMYRPFDMARFVNAFPETTKSIAVLDRTKEPGSAGEPLYVDTITAIFEKWTSTMPIVVGGRYGLSSKEFTPAMIKSVFDNLNQDKPKNHFTVGIYDDVTHTSLDFDPDYSIESDSVVRALFYGLGSDGTVGANKNSIKIIGENTDNYAQGYFVYDSKKSGSMTVSHLRFGPQAIRSNYQINKANFIACHQTTFLDRYNILEDIVEGGTFLLNSTATSDNVWNTLPQGYQEHIINKKLKFYVIDASSVARESGMRNRINTVMQTCFFAISNILPSEEEAIDEIKKAIKKTFGRKGQDIVEMNLNAVDNTLSHLYAVDIPQEISSNVQFLPPVIETAPNFVHDILGSMISRQGDNIPVSALPNDGTYPTGTTQYEKRNLADEIPVWDSDICIQCGKCAFVCPHAVIRIKSYEPDAIDGAPETFKSVPARDRDWEGLNYSIQVSPEDCTACGLCIDICPVKNKSQSNLKALNMMPQEPLREQENENWDFFLDIPELPRNLIKVSSIRQQQVQQPLFEFSGACAGCGETPYLKLLTQLFGDRTIIANATGCSSIYGGNLPTTPWAKNEQGYGPAWSNSLFEDNAEFGLGMRVALDKQTEYARELVAFLAEDIGGQLTNDLLSANQSDEACIYEQRERVESLKTILTDLDTPESKQLLTLADTLVKKSMWIVGGDGWAYDIGYGGLDHVLASGRNVNVLVMDTEVYSNTGGQASKATPLAAIAKFAAGGKPSAKKDLGMMMMSYGNIYVAQVAMGGKDEQTLRAFIEAEAYDGPSIIIAYSHCIAHGIHMPTALKNQKAAVDSGQWLLYRYHPDRTIQNKNPLILDSRPPKLPVTEYLRMENRFRMLELSNPKMAKKLFAQAQVDVNKRREYYEYLANRPFDTNSEEE